MSLATNVNNLATRIATEVKALRTLINGNATDLTALTTTSKTNLVSAINEVKASVASAAGINDATTSTSSTWSSTKITSYVGTSTSGLINDTTPSTSTAYSSTKTNTVATAAAAALIDDVTPSASKVYSSTKTNTAISAAVSALVNSAPAALDTLKELSDALGGDASFAATTATALGNRVRTDTAAQGLTGTQQGNARTNILAASQAALDALVTNVGDTTTDFVATFVAGLV
jgi:hypothetical protein